jgi:hypothetical protein
MGAGMIREIAGHRYDLEPLLVENFENLDRWITLESDGVWQAKDRGLEGEWVQNSPSIFLREKVAGNFLWEIDVTRVPGDSGFVERYSASKWAEGDPAFKYNFNFWLRADVPPGSPGKFFEEYPKYLKTGWNGMGDDHWHSYFTTVVRSPTDNWVRLRRGPGYEMKEDIHDIVPHLPYQEKHRFTFAIVGDRIRCYFDEKLVYDYRDLTPYREGYLGLCVWICKTRFENMRVWRVTN